MRNPYVDTYRSVGGAVSAARYYTMERISHTDALTGAKIMQLTSYPILSHTLYYHCPCVTPDSKTLIVLSYTRPGRLSSPDVWRVNLDGTEIAPVLERPWLSGFVLSPDGKTVYAQDGGTLVAAPMDGGDVREIGRIEGVSAPATILGSVTADGKYYVSAAVMESGGTALVRYATDGSSADVIVEEDFFSHVQVNPGGSEILYCGPSPAQPREDLGPHLIITDIDGGKPPASGSALQHGPLRVVRRDGQGAFHGAQAVRKHRCRRRGRSVPRGGQGRPLLACCRDARWRVDRLGHQLARHGAHAHQHCHPGSGRRSVSRRVRADTRSGRIRIRCSARMASTSSITRTEPVSGRSTPWKCPSPSARSCCRARSAYDAHAAQSCRCYAPRSRHRSRWRGQMVHGRVQALPALGTRPDSGYRCREGERAGRQARRAMGRRASTICSPKASTW